MGFFADKASGEGFVKFDDTTVNQPQVMKVVGTYQVKPSLYQGQQKTTQKGQPIFEAHVPVEIDGKRMTFSDGGKWRLQADVGAAVTGTGAPDLEIGGILTVTFTGKVPAKGGGMANTYDVSYERAPEGSPLATPADDPSTQAQGAPQQQPAAAAGANPWG